MVRPSKFENNYAQIDESSMKIISMLSNTITMNFIKW